MRQPPVLDQQPARTDDEEAEYQAAMARRHASEMVRDHLETHAANNPGASSDYVTWIATLHPENADISVDQRFFIPGNPWWTIYEETKSHQIRQIPTATAVAVADEEANAQTSSSHNQTKEDEAFAGKDAPSFCMTCSPFNLMAGFLISMQALLAVIICELSALVICYFPAALFYHLAQVFAPPNVCTAILYSFFMIFYSAFALCDSIVLLVSVFVTEIVAGAGLVFGTLTGGVIWGMYWHQQIRRMCHSVRIIFRNKFSGIDPPRTFLFTKNRDDAMDQQNLTAEVVPVAVEHDIFQSQPHPKTFGS